LKVFTKASASPLLRGLYAGVVIGTRPSSCAQSTEAVAVYGGPLSESHWIACGAVSVASPDRAQYPPTVCLPPMFAHGASRRILRPQGEQLKRGALHGGPGTCAFFPRGVRHAWKNSGSETGRVLFLYTPAAAGAYESLLHRRPDESPGEAEQKAGSNVTAGRSSGRTRSEARAPAPTPGA